MNTIPVLNRNIALNYSESMQPEEKVNYLVQNLRLTVGNFKNLSEWTGSKCLDTKWTQFKKNDYDIQKECFRGEGRALTEMLMRMHSEKKGISIEEVDISSLAELCSEENAILKSNLLNNKHSFAIATIGEKRYIIDCAYRQFFQTEDNDEKEESLDLEPVMSNDEQKKKIAKQILENGWIEATPENIKNYLDGFIETLAEDKDVELPTEQEYIENIKGKSVSIVEKEVHEYRINEIWKLYIKKWSPNISDETQNFFMEHRDLFSKIKSKVQISKNTFSIISSDGKQYIRTNSEDIEFTPESLQRYLDTMIMEAARAAGIDEKIVTPSIHEYYSLYPCGELVKKDYKYIIDSEPYNYNSEFKNDDFREDMSDEEKIISIVQRERRLLMKENDLATASLAGECEDSTLRVMIDSASKGFEDVTCLSPENYIGRDGTAGHNCSIISLNGKSYLIDCTYRQFFEENKSESCGKYMINDELRKCVAEQILKNGWIEATPENIKAYMDGFEMGKRRSFEETGISAEEYIKRFSEHETYPIHIVTTRQVGEKVSNNGFTGINEVLQGENGFITQNSVGKSTVSRDVEGIDFADKRVNNDKERTIHINQEIEQISEEGK